jgi:hypothetical protein
MTVKIVGVPILILVILMGLSLGMDLYMGLELQTSVRNAISPLAVMETIEYTVFLMLIMIMIGRNVYVEVKKRKQGGKRSKKRASQ